MDESFTIGVLSPLLAGFYFGGILKGVARAAAKAGGQVIAMQTFDPGMEELVYLRPSTFRYPIGWEHISGFVVILNAADRTYIQALRATGKPIVMVSQAFPGWDGPVVVPDNQAGVRASVIHLIEHGHRRIAFAGHVAQDDIRERYQSYQDTLVEYGIEPDARYFFDTSDNIESGGERAARRMMAAGLPSTAVVCGTDFNAIGLMRSLSDAGYHLPDDQAVVGFDGVNAAKYVTPALSTAEARFDSVGEMAGGLLLRHQEGKPAVLEYHRVPTEFVVRESCGCPPEDNATSGLRGKIQTLHLDNITLERTLTTQYEISMDLLRSHGRIPGRWSGCAGPGPPAAASGCGRGSRPARSIRPWRSSVPSTATPITCRSRSPPASRAASHPRSCCTGPTAARPRSSTWCR